MRESISISLPKDVKAELDRFSNAHGIARSDAVRAALQDYLFVQKFRTLRTQMLPKAQRDGVFTDEDVFRAMQ